MAYQPVQLPAHMGVETAMQGLGESLRNLGGVRRDNRNFAAEQERQAQLDARQKQGDFQQARVMAEKAAAEGNYALAEDIMRPFAQGIQQQDPAAEAKSLKAQMGFTDAPSVAPPSQGPTPAGQALMAKMGMGAGLASQNPMMGVQNGGVDSEAVGMEAPSMPQARPLAQPAELDQLMGASHGNGGMNEFERIRAAQQAEGDTRNQNFKKAWGGAGDPEQRRRMTGTDYMGRPFTIDPQASVEFQRHQQDQERARTADLIGPAAAEEDRAALVQLVNAGVPVEQAFAKIDARRQSRDELAQKKADLAEQRAYNEAYEDRRDKRDFKQATTLAGINARALAGRQENRPATPGERETGALAENLYALANEAGTMKPLSPAAQRTIIEDAALSDTFDKNPMAKAVAIKMGQYKTLEDKLSPEDNAYYSNMRELASLLLRKESGAAISQQEWTNMFSRYAPVAGDTPEIAARKQTNLMRRIEAIAKGSKAGDSVAAQAKAAQGPAKPTAAPMKPPKQRPIDDMVNEALGTK